MRTLRFPGTLFLALVALPGIALAQDPDPAGGGEPAGEEKPEFEELHGLRVDLRLPKGEPPEGGRSLLIFLHSREGSGSEIVEHLAPLVDRGFVVAAPWSTGDNWNDADIEAVENIARDLVARFQVPEDRRHLGGMWYGARHLQRIAFRDDLRFRTCTWVSWSFAGGTTPKWVREHLSGLFLWGEDEGKSRVDRYLKGLDLLGEKARTAVGKAEPGLGRNEKDEPEFPVKLVPFYGYFLECMEGRFTPGRDLSFEWLDSLPEGVAAMKEGKTGGLVYVHDPAGDAPTMERTKTLQNEIFFDRIVRHFAGQLVPVRLEKAAAKELLEKEKVKELPALLVFKKGGKEVLRVLSGEIDVKKLVPVLRAASPDPDLPK